MDGIVVSNHGGRQVDGAIATMDALPAIVEAVAGRIPIVLDSGIRSGADVFRALALGASAVGLGRPYVWGLAAGGEEGVREVIRNLRADFDLTMGLGGVASVRDIGRETSRALERRRGRRLRPGRRPRRLRAHLARGARGARARARRALDRPLARRT